MDNDSADPATLEYLDSTPHRVIPFREPFNYSKINNVGVSMAEGEYVLLLNDDTEITSGEWLEAMLEHAQRPEVGAVGAKLVYPDGRIQHAGVLTGVGGTWGLGVATHSHQFYPSTSPGYLGTIAKVTNYSAVTAACMLLRKSVFEEVGASTRTTFEWLSTMWICACGFVSEVLDNLYALRQAPPPRVREPGIQRRSRRSPLHERALGGSAGQRPYYNPNFSMGSGDFNLRADMLRPSPAAGDRATARRPRNLVQECVECPRGETPGIHRSPPRPRQEFVQDRAGTRARRQGLEGPAPRGART